MTEQLNNQQATVSYAQKEIKITGKSRRGFASMDKERHKAVSSKGGKTERTKAFSDATQRSSYEGL